eukprot:XP_001694716.1 lysophosphatidic acid acyltransferase [Chlamydomonas reinhardtii]
MSGITALPMERRPLPVAPSPSAKPELPARSALVCHAAAASVPLPNSDSAPQPNVLLAKIRAIMFFAWSFLLSLPLFVTMMVMAPLVLAFDKYRRLAQHFVNNLWACASTAPFYKVTDIYSLFHLQRPFKFISKTSNFLIPIIGWSMFLTGHVMINRVDRRSQLKCLQQCRDLLAEGAPVLFFPEGEGGGKEGRELQG